MSQEVPAHDDDQVPVWLAVVVLVLLLAVVAVSGYVVRGLVAPAKQTTAVDREIIGFESAVESAPDNVESRLSLGYAYQRAGRLREALEQYDAVLQLQPSDSAALFNKGRILIEQGRDREGEGALWDVLERDPTHVLAAKELGEHYASQGEYRSLVYAVRPVVEAKESSADLQYLMGLAYENLEQIEWAEARYRLALKYYPDMPEAHEALERLGVVE